MSRRERKLLADIERGLSRVPFFVFRCSGTVRLLIFFLCCGTAAPASAQISITNLGEFQAGRLPGGLDSARRATYYGDLTVDYFNAKLIPKVQLQTRFSLTGFQAPTGRSDFVKLYQKLLSARHRNFEVQAGNYFATFGRGMLLRAFQLPGFIYEDRVERIRHEAIRDLFGFRATVTLPLLEAAFVQGKPQDALVTPTGRRTGSLWGGDFRVKPFPRSEALRLGGSFLHLKSQGESEPVASGVLEANPLQFFGEKVSAKWGADLYVEYALKHPTFQRFFSFGWRDSAYGFYGSMNLSYARVGLSFEYKDYHNFLLRAGGPVNDPPALIREQSPILLNRETHVLVPEDERGFQIELAAGITTALRVVANLSRAENEIKIGRRKKPVFLERYLEVDYHPLPNWSFRGFADLAQDQFRLQKRRLSGGLAADFDLTKTHSVGFDLQAQKITRDLPFAFIKPDFTNLYLGLKYAWSPLLTVTLSGERSDDPFEDTDTEKGPHDWVNVGLSLRIADSHQIDLFYGRRRGGPACDHGYCISVLPFKGFEMRMTNNLWF